MAERMGNGVRIRRDGRGDAWANEHREALGKKFYLNDIDAFFGLEVFGANTGDRLFLEYEPDNYENKFSAIRDFAMVAMFDRKSTEAAAFHESSLLSRGVYLWLCRVIADVQPQPPKFFYVIGREQPPWRMIQIDIYSGDRTGSPVEVDGQSFKQVWSQLGLTRLRNELRRHVDPPR